MLNQRFRAVYMAALVVFCIGLLGTVLVPKARANGSKRITPVVAAITPTFPEHSASAAKLLFGFTGLGLLSSTGLAVLYARSK